MINTLRSLMEERRQQTIAVGLGIALALVATVLGLMLALIGPIYSAALLITLAGAAWVMWDLEHALWSVILVITVLPFATFPVDIGLTPTFLDMALGAAVFLYLMQWMTGERRRLKTTPVHAFVILFALLSVFSFVLGMRHGGMNLTVMRRFAELLLAMAFALILVDVLRTRQQVKRFVTILMVGGTLAALLGIVLWVLPDPTAESILRQLDIVGYPTAGIIRYIEQNPALSERAIGTAVNPNSLGGMLVMIAALVAPQIVTKEPITGKRWHAFPLLGLLVLCLILTFSRGSMLAFAVAVGFIALLRYRKLLAVLFLLGLLLLVLPWTQAYIERFLAGFQGADLATQMRFGEYRDALRLIQRYPLLGVGFISTPDIDIYLGVASVYLTMATNMGLLGLAAFIGLMISLGIYALNARSGLAHLPGFHPIWLGLAAGIVGALFNGIFDHYFFNLEFMSAATLFWLYVGLLMAVSRLALEAEEAETRTVEQVLEQNF